MLSEIKLICCVWVYKCSLEVLTFETRGENFAYSLIYCRQEWCPDVSTTKVLQFKKGPFISVPVSGLCLHMLSHFKHRQHSRRWLSSYRWGNWGFIQFTEHIRQVNVRIRMWAWVCLLQAACRLSLLLFLTEGETWMTPTNFYVGKVIRGRGFISLNTSGSFSPFCNGKVVSAYSQRSESFSEVELQTDYIERNIKVNNGSSLSNNRKINYCIYLMWY